MVLEIARKRYVELFGPTVGDKVRLADTDSVSYTHLTLPTTPYV